MHDVDIFDIANPPVLTSERGSYTISQDHLLAADRQAIDVIEDLIQRNTDYIFESVTYPETGAVKITWRKRDNRANEESTV